MDKKEAMKKISALTGEARNLIREAEEIAKEAKVSFSFDVAYGMGGTYVPEGAEDGYMNNGESGWQASSHSC